MLPAAVDAAMTASMGPDWRWHFREFDERRAAAASIGQVHRAVWRDGTPVAVKVMYPGGRAAVAGDLEQLRRFSALANVFLPGADVEGVLAAITECGRAAVCCTAIRTPAAPGAARRQARRRRFRGVRGLAAGRVRRVGAGLRARGLPRRAPRAGGGPAPAPPVAPAPISLLRAADSAQVSLG
ncbi:AarF/UbiB family protein [Nocardia amikacinitolerans]|uniref:AarF/UbiB family protein n=1 Tax=Nocardia amikacinitolerans TaxID=756689 RepID=UPI0020A33365|nr:AarF/UbiB family protein [Nocardia amikacinitolerans]